MIATKTCPFRGKVDGNRETHARLAELRKLFQAAEEKTTIRREIATGAFFDSRGPDIVYENVPTEAAMESYSKALYYVAALIKNGGRNDPIAMLQVLEMLRKCTVIKHETEERGNAADGHKLTIEVEDGLISILAHRTMFEMILTVGDPTKDFARIITNLNVGPFDGRAETQHEALFRVKRYLDKVAGKEGRAYCPFVAGIEQDNGYYVKIIGEEYPDEISIRRAAKEIMEAFEFISPLQAEKEVDYKTAIIAFSHAFAEIRYFCEKVEKVHAEVRPGFLERGLMIAHMTPFHAQGNRNGEGKEPMLVSEIPLFAVRRMHPSDIVFMKTPEAMAAYEKHFGKR